MTPRLTILLVAAAFAVGCSQNGASQAPAGGPAGGASATAPAAGSSGRPTDAGPAGSSSSSAAAAMNAAPAEQKAQFREVTIPSGIALSIKLASTVASDKSKVEDPVRGSLTKPVVVNGATAVPAGSPVSGSVLEAKEAGRVKGLASIAIRFDRLSVENETHNIRTARIAREAKPTKGEDAKKVGIGAGAGALVGALAGGKKGALVGGAVGAGAGTGVVLATRGDEVRLPAGTVVTTTLQEPLTIQVPVHQ
jgi:hypothetical protein